MRRAPSLNSQLATKCEENAKCERRCKFKNVKCGFGCQCAKSVELTCPMLLHRFMPRLRNYLFCVQLCKCDSKIIFSTCHHYIDQTKGINQGTHKNKLSNDGALSLASSAFPPEHHRHQQPRPRTGLLATPPRQPRSSGHAPRSHLSHRRLLAYLTQPRQTSYIISQ